MAWRNRSTKKKSKLPSMWPQIFSIIIGLWLMIAPALFPHTTAAAANAHIFGPLAVTFAVVALWEATRLVRWANLPIGLWLILAPWVLGFELKWAIINCVVVGMLIAFLSTKKGIINKKYAGGWSTLFE